MQHKINTLLLVTMVLCSLASSGYSYSHDYTNTLDSIPKFDLDKYKEKYKQLKKLSSVGSIKIDTEVNIDTSVNANYTLSVNAQTSFAGVTIPINFNYSNGKSIYNYQLNTVKLPSYKRIGISPNYKNITAHLGYRSLTYSDNSLNGHQFKGVGLEYKGDIIYASFFNGNLVRSTIPQLSLLGSIDAPFERKGWGIKLGISSNEEKDNLSIIILKIDDQYNVNQLQSIPNYIKPAENAVLAILAKKEILDNLSIINDYHFSAYSKNTNQERIDILTGNTVYNLLGLFTKREGSKYGHSLKSQLIYTLDKMEFSINNTYIGPDYISLGSLNFQNNLNNSTFGTTFNLLDKKMRLTSEIGIQLSGLRENENSKRRLILNLVVLIKQMKRLLLIFSIANFSNQSRVLYTQAINSNLDSLSLVNDNFNTSIGIQRTLNNERQSSIGMIASYSNSSTITNDIIDDSQRNRVYILSSNYNMSFSEKMTFQSSMSYSYLQNNFLNTHVTTPSASLTYQFSKDINNNSNLGLSYVVNNNNTFNLNITDTVDWKISKKQKMQMRLSGIYRISKSDQGVPYLIIVNCNYSYNF